MTTPKRLLVTAALPYANGPIHLGHLAGAYLPADLYVRYQRLRGRDVVFICGSDEHGVPITLTADQRGDHSPGSGGPLPCGEQSGVRSGSG